MLCAYQMGSAAGAESQHTHRIAIKQPASDRSQPAVVSNDSSNTKSPSQNGEKDGPVVEGDLNLARDREHAEELRKHSKSIPLRRLQLRELRIEANRTPRPTNEPIAATDDDVERIRQRQLVWRPRSAPPIVRCRYAAQ